MRMTFITVGDTGRRVGGHIFNTRLCDELRALGDDVAEIVASGAAPDEQEAAAAGMGARVAAIASDVIVVDALARVVCAPWLDRWRARRPVVALVHELASVAGAGTRDEAATVRERAVEAPLLRADLLITVSRDGRAILEAHGVPSARIRVVQPGSNRPRPVAPSGASGDTSAAGQLTPADDGGLARRVNYLGAGGGGGGGGGGAGRGRGGPGAPPPSPALDRHTLGTGETPALPGSPAANARAPGGLARPLQALCVAQWIPRKGIDTLIAAWARIGGSGVGARGPRATLRLIGETDADPAYAATVRAAIAAIVATGDSSIVVSGAVDAGTLEAAYAAADLFVLPSRYEGYGSVYAEALLRGLPIVACDAGAVPELVGPDAGILVSPGDPTALAHALQRLLDDDDLRVRLAAGSRRRGAHIPAWDDTVRGVRAVLEEAISRRR